MTARQQAGKGGSEEEWRKGRGEGKKGGGVRGKKK